MIKQKDTLPAELKVFYRDLKAVVTDQFINDLLVKFAKMEYDRANTVLKNSKDTAELYRAQGEIKAWERLINIKDLVTSIVANS